MHILTSIYLFPQIITDGKFYLVIYTLKSSF